MLHTDNMIGGVWKKGTAQERQPEEGYCLVAAFSFFGDDIEDRLFGEDEETGVRRFVLGHAKGATALVSSLVFGARLQCECGGEN